MCSLGLHFFWFILVAKWYLFACASWTLRSVSNPDTGAVQTIHSAFLKQFLDRSCFDYQAWGRRSISNCNPNRIRHYVRATI